MICLPFRAISAVVNAIKNASKSRKDKKAQEAVVGKAVTPDGRQIKVRYNMDEGGSSSGGDNSDNAGKGKGKRKSRKNEGFAQTKQYPHKNHPANYRRKNGDEIEYITFTHSDEVHLDNGETVKTIPLTSNVNPDERGKSKSYVYPRIYEGKRSALGKEHPEYSLTEKDAEIVDGLYNSLPKEKVPVTGGSSKAKTMKKRKNKPPKN